MKNFTERRIFTRSNLDRDKRAPCDASKRNSDCLDAAARLVASSARLVSQIHDDAGGLQWPSLRAGDRAMRLMLMVVFGD